MALRDCGVTGAQIVMACGAPQLNKMRGFITDGLLKRLPVAPSSEGHTVYRLEVTTKGTKRIEGNGKRAAEAEAKGEGETKPKATSKAKGASKPKTKAKATSKAKGASKAKAKPAVSEADKPAEGAMPVIPADTQTGAEMLVSLASNQA
jgi:hypothetical protein